jgi:Domain of unknown function (DUF4387)
MKRTLADAASLIRSKNAGPFWLTFDVMFDELDVYEAVRDQEVLTRDKVSALFRQDPSAVRVFAHESARAIKFSFPRPVSSGCAQDTDVFGGQQYAPLLDLTVELPDHDAENGDLRN